jgi:hypothetical protein
MNFKDVSKSIRQIASDTFSDRDLRNNIIVMKGTAYVVYDRFVINNQVNCWTVKSDGHCVEFSTSRAALAWCILIKAGKLHAARDLHRFDLNLVRKQTDIDITLLRIKAKDTDEDKKQVLQCRLTEDMHSRQVIRKQLSKRIESAKYIQIKGTSLNESNRFNYKSHV